MMVSEVMKRASAITSCTPVREADKALRRQGLKILPVVDAGRLVGVVTRGDIARALPSDATTLSKWEIAYWLDAVKVGEFMKAPLALSPHVDLMEAVRVSWERGIYNFPISERGVLLGMLYEEDIFRCLYMSATRPVARMESRVEVFDKKRTSFVKRLFSRRCV